MTSKGQLVIPAELRRKHGIKAGTTIHISEDDLGRIILQPVTEQHIRRVRGMLAGGPDLVAEWKKERMSKYDE